MSRESVVPPKLSVFCYSFEVTLFLLSGIVTGSSVCLSDEYAPPLIFRIVSLPVCPNKVLTLSCVGVLEEIPAPYVAK